MDLAVIDPAIALWDPLDRLYMRGELRRLSEGVPGASLWPWESDSQEISAAWERLTRPGHLPVLEGWGGDMAGWGELALGWTAVAIETCRLRGSGPSGVADCTRRAVGACRLRYPGQAFGSASAPDAEPGAAPDRRVRGGV